MDNKDKSINLFRYIKEICTLKYKGAITDIDNQIWTCFLDEIPKDDENIFLFFLDKEDSVNEVYDDNDVILKVRKPETSFCPAPPASIKEWLLPGWDNFNNDATIRENTSSDEKIAIEKFEDSLKRTLQFQEWKAKRDKWCVEQKRNFKTRIFFKKLYETYQNLERDPDSLEFVIGNGIIDRCDGLQSEINHPILLKRLAIKFEVATNTICICDTENETKFYTTLLQVLEDINHAVLKDFDEELKENFYHPLDRNDTPVFLKRFIHALSPDSIFINNDEVDTSDSKIALTIRPVFFLRKRVDGTLKAIDDVIKDIEDNACIPAYLNDIVGGGKIDILQEQKDESIEAQLAAISGEDAEILLSKEANREQLEIAQRINLYNAVLVQGPPGTGKTHTIANLLGHFLAQGKSVLVTSHTKKALSVLKDKLYKGIQNLCVAVLDDNNKDMEISVDGIGDFLSRNTIDQLQKKIRVTENERLDIINKLADIRKRIYAIKFKEFNSIVYNGESFAPVQIAEFVKEYADSLSYIPGKVELYKPLPVFVEELRFLYQSNEIITKESAQELEKDLPDPNLLIKPVDFEKLVDEYNFLTEEIQRISSYFNGELSFDYINDFVQQKISDKQSEVIIKSSPLDKLVELENFICDFSDNEQWMIHVATCGAKGQGFKSKYELLINSINDTVEYFASINMDMLGKKISIANDTDYARLEETINKMHNEFSQSGKIGFFSNLFNKSFKTALEQVKINGKELSSQQDCDLILKYISLKSKREMLAGYWDELMAAHGLPRFNDLDEDNQEAICYNYIPGILKYLDWYELYYKKVLNLVEQAGLKIKELSAQSNLESDFVRTEKNMKAIKESIPLYIKLAKAFLGTKQIDKQFLQLKAMLSQDNRVSSTICTQLKITVSELQKEQYAKCYNDLTQEYAKYDLLAKRKAILEKIKPSAPDWAQELCSSGATNMPENIVDAWKWKQFSGIIEEIIKEPFEQLQQQSIQLAKALREKTALLAQDSAWYHLLKRVEADTDMRQALNGWKQTVKKIGKGTGKNAPIHKKEAKKLMAKCQMAVPAWIMPVNKAMESFNPKDNKFDIVIVDEASQSDISALAIIYMAKKVIIVGDDKQVSPSAIGIVSEQVNRLIEIYIKDKIPNWHLYDPSSSLYDIASTTFKPLMLKEHFRCVPEIIGYSNKLSYNGEIKPLREACHSHVMPAVVSFRVENGKRSDTGKVNSAEAKNIVALMMACIEQEEYKDATFGVITLLGDEQAFKIQQLINEKIPSEVEQRRILCGNASHFQGDERNVIFLSMVDSNEEDTPLRLTTEGKGQSTKQRYNVAASRAQDQLWVVHSLDYVKDLKADDIRRDLLEYAQNPKAVKEQIKQVEAKADSPFEIAVAKYLLAQGYNITQQWKAGYFRIDIVVQFEKIKIAIECDGDRFHSGEEKIRSDMERQTILERVGWRFIRIRGSEYYKNPDKTMGKVIKQLNDYGVYPEAKAIETIEQNDVELLERVKIRAAQILNEWANNKEDLILQEENSVKVKSKRRKTTTKPLNQKVELESMIEQKEKDELMPKNIVEETKELVFKTNNEENQIKNIKDKTITEELEKHFIEYIDTKQGVIYILFDQAIQEKAENILQQFNAEYTLEKRGVLATNNWPAWRIKNI